MCILVLYLIFQCFLVFLDLTGTRIQKSQNTAFGTSFLMMGMVKSRRRIMVD